MKSRHLFLAAAIALMGAYAVDAPAAETKTASPGPSIPLTPAFTTQQLARQPTHDWITNGGSLANDRYSPLKEINESNVAGLKGTWLTHLNGSGVGAKYSAEGQPLEYKGVLYVPTGQDDVFAVSVDTGKILWQYKANLETKISTICCGWLSRGVALGDGKVYIGQLDGNLVALDQKTGKVAWTTAAANWHQGFTLTAAPLYVNGMIIIGTAGGEYEIRGRLMAFDAKTGKELWRFYTIPGPGEKGHETWPQQGDAWQHGGAPIWQTPSVDTKLGMVYFSTGNASPDYDGSVREGANLYASSLVALDLKTGKFRWAYQFVHHDIWDYDAPSPTLQFDTTIDGKAVKGIGEASKTGWLYLLDRTNGKPIFPIIETPVPQDANQKTFATQPVPSTPALANQVPTPDQVDAVKKVLKASGPVTVGKEIFTPFWHDPVVIAPGPAGGTNWPPSSYSQANHMIYVCGQNGVAGLTADTEEEAPPGADGTVPHATGSTNAAGNGFHNPGQLTAVDITTGKIAWQNKFPDACYSGSMVTAGNLLFVGRNGGDLDAFRASTGELLWHFQTGAGANNVATSFEHKGHQYIAFYAGGNALGGTAHGDNLWLFGLDGKMDEVAASAAGQAIAHAGEVTAAPSVATAPGDDKAGEAVFSDNCSACHGANGLGGNGGPNLSTLPTAKDSANVQKQVTDGGKSMPPFKDVITPQDIANVTAYVIKDITHGK